MGYSSLVNTEAQGQINRTLYSLRSCDVST